MSDANEIACLKTALRAHEIGRDSPYRISFASKGNSGASFGYMQGDLAAGQTEARTAFMTCLTKAGFSKNETDGVMSKLSVHCASNPLTPEETRRIDSALKASSDVVDEMDDSIFAAVQKDLDECVATAKIHGRSISTEALVYMMLWINMTGRPSSLLKWLSEQEPKLAKKISLAPHLVNGQAMVEYLAATKYYSENPKSFRHMQQCVATGMKKMEKAETK